MSVDRRLWKLDFKKDAAKAYSVKAFANGRLDVLANGKPVATAIHDHWARVALARAPSDVAHHAHMLATEIGVQSEAKLAQHLKKKKFELQF